MPGEQLFGAQAVGLEWLPDEILFSLASRYHCVSANALAANTCMQLFGHRRQGCAHDFPSRVEQFVKNTGGELGTAESIIRDRTILPFYLPFRSQAEGIAAENALRGSGIGSLKFRLGLLTSRFRAHHPLKACPQCLVEDRARHHVAYWRRAHQLPGTWTCAVHGCILRECLLKSTSVERFGFVLPEESTLRTIIPDCAVSQALLTAAAKLTAANQRLMALAPSLRLESGTLTRAMRVAICSKAGCPEAKLSRIVPALAPEYVAHCKLLSTIPEFRALPATLAQAGAHLRQLMRVPRTGTHPLRTLIAISWLFDGFDSFMEAYGGASKNAACVEAASVAKEMPPEDHRRATLIALLQTSSMRQAALEVGIDTTTAMAWAAEAGISSRRRPKVLSDPLRSKLVDMLLMGADKQVAADAGGISVGTITRLLRTEVDLYARWTCARKEIARTQNRKAWSNVASSHRMQGLKFCRAIEPAAYAWLYRNDRAWLCESLQSLKLPKAGTNHSRTDWDNRDATFADLIRAAGADIFARTHERIFLWQIYQVVPDLKPKLRQISRMPLTKRALTEVMSWSAKRRPAEVASQLAL